MNDSERSLIRFVCDGDMRNAQKAVKIILNSISSKKDEQFKENMFRKLESKREFIELPYNLQHLLIAEDTEEFPEARFLLRNEEKSITQKIVAIYRQHSERVILRLCNLAVVDFKVLVRRVHANQVV